MDYKVTKKRLSNHLSYDWIKYICIILGAIFFWTLVLTMTATRVPNNKSASMLLVMPGVDENEIATVQKDISKLLNETAVQVEAANMPPTAKQTMQLLAARLANREGDVFVVDNRQKTGNETLDKQIPSSFNSYVDDGIYFSLEDLIVQTINYKFDENEFRARVKKESKFNKIDTSAQMEVAIVLEKERIRTLKQDAIRLSGYLGIAEKLQVNSPVTKVQGLAYSYKKYEQAKYLKDSNFEHSSVEEEKVWGINLAEVVGVLPLPKIVNLIHYAEKDDVKEETIREYAMGVIFANDNMPYTPTYIKIFNYLIERYK